MICDTLCDLFVRPFKLGLSTLCGKQCAYQTGCAHPNLARKVKEGREGGKKQAGMRGREGSEDG